MGLLRLGMAVLKTVATCGQPIHRRTLMKAGPAEEKEQPPEGLVERTWPSFKYCGLCEDPSREVYGGAMSGCNHRFCLPCLQEHITREINPSTVGKAVLGLVFCPSPAGCCWEFSRSEIRGIIGEQAMNTWENLLMINCDTIYSEYRAALHSSHQAATLGYSKGKERYKMYKALVAMEDMCCQGFLRKERPKGNEKKLHTKPRAQPAGVGHAGGWFQNNEAAWRAIEKFYRGLKVCCATLRKSLDSCTTPGRLDCATWVLLQRAGTLQKVFHRLMSNDSILDISSKTSCGAYLEFLALLINLGKHDGLLPLLFRQSRVAPEQGQSELEVDAFDTMEVLYKQAKGMMRALEAAGCSQQAPTKGESKVARLFCECYETLLAQGAKHGCQQQVTHTSKGKTTSTVETVDAGTKRTGTKTSITGKGKVEEDADDVVAQYKGILRPLQFRSVNMAGKDGLYLHYYYKGQVVRSKSVHNNPKRMQRIAREFATLASSLPLEWGSSIHLCTDEARIDVMRALVVGPQKTPYQNGVFLFDIFLPTDYPNSPPSVHFLTTGGGTVRFNPNLYNSGHICLSLLGTFAGPQWLPGQSTLLQVLVSLQSLLFTEEPYYNEPAYNQGPPKPKAASAYNLGLRGYTLSIAVLQALRNPDPYFADIIQQHFRFKRREIEQQCNEWLRTESELAKSIKKELRRLYGNPGLRNIS